MLKVSAALGGLAVIGLVAMSSPARADDAPQPKGGALKGAAVGAVAGHVMGGHAKTGAVVGAVAGHHEKAKSQERINAGGQP